MAKRTLKTLTEKLNFFIGRVLCNSLTQLAYFACCAWYPNLSMSLKNKLKTAQNDCIRFYLKMERSSHIRPNHSKKLIGYQAREKLINALQ